MTLSTNGIRIVLLFSFLGIGGCGAYDFENYCGLNGDGKHSIERMRDKLRTYGMDECIQEKNCYIRRVDEDRYLEAKKRLESCEVGLRYEP